jgi:hypothetical protein
LLAPIKLDGPAKGAFQLREFLAAGHEVLQLFRRDLAATGRSERLPAVEHGEAVADS